MRPFLSPYITSQVSSSSFAHELMPCRAHILYLIERHNTVVIVGETGSGKTTQIPQYLMEAGWAEGELLQ